MTLAIIQLILVCAAGYGLFHLFRRAASPGGWIAVIVATGFIVRALASQALLWVSWLELPLGSQLQLGSGFWFFGLDARGYFRMASRLMDHGFHDVFFISRGSSSPFFVQMLSASMAMFGRVASSALVMNLAAYLGSCAIVVALARPSRARLLAIGALSFSPSAILWSTQGLKDVLFVFLLVAFFGSVAVWNRKETLAGKISWTLVVLLLVWAITGIRWYAAVMILLGLLVFIVTATLQSKAPLRELAVGVPTLVLCMYTFLAAAGGYAPGWLHDLAKPWRADGVRAMKPISEIRARAESTRHSFDRVGGATLIRVGERFHSPEAEGAGGMDEEGLRRALASDLPQRPATRLLAGFAVMTIPRAVLQPLGLIQLEGGRGMWLFAEIDTIVFDVVAILALGAVFLSLRQRMAPSPLTLLILVSTSFLALALFYVVSNFGTLFRHRQMVYVGLALIPVTVEMAKARYFAVQSRSRDVSMGSMGEPEATS